MVSCEENPCCEEKNVTGFLFSRAKGVQIKNNPINMIHNLGSRCLMPRSGVLIALSRCTCIGENRTCILAMVCDDEQPGTQNILSCV